MPYKPKRGATKYRQLLATGSGQTRKIRRIIEDIITTGPDRSELYLKLNAITLLSVYIDDTFTNLADFDDPAKASEEEGA